MQVVATREFHPEGWKPTGEEIARIYSFLREDVAALAETVGDDDNTTEAVKLLYDFCSKPFEQVRGAVVDRFIDYFDAVNGDIDEFYGKDAEVSNLIKIVLFPVKRS